MDAHPWGGLRHTTAPWWVVSPRRGLTVARCRGFAPHFSFMVGVGFALPRQKGGGVRYVKWANGGQYLSNNWPAFVQDVASVGSAARRHFRGAPDGRNIIRSTRHVEFSEGWVKRQRGGHR